jgi:hypothetical protein
LHTLKKDISVKDACVIATKLIDLSFKIYAPQEAFPEGSYEKYANHYMIDEKRLFERMYMLRNIDKNVKDQEAVNKLVQEVKDELGLNKISVSLPELSEAVNNAKELSPKVESVDKIKEKEMLNPGRVNDEKQAMERFNNKNVNDHVSKQLLDIFKESLSNDAHKDAITKTILGTNKGIIFQMWRAFDKAENAEAKENAIIQHSQKLFNETFKWVKSVQFEEDDKEHDMIVATQRITNLMLKQYSPAASASAYDKFCDNYLVSDEKFMDGFMRNNFGITEMSKGDLADIMNDLKTDLADKMKNKDIIDKNVEPSKKHNNGLVK